MTELQIDTLVYGIILFVLPVILPPIIKIIISNYKNKKTANKLILNNYKEQELLLSKPLDKPYPNFEEDRLAITVTKEDKEYIKSLL